MVFLHRILLKGPWEYVGGADSDHSNVEKPARFAESRSRIHLPATWGEVFEWLDARSPGKTFQHLSLEFARWFHQPTNLETGETVWLVIQGLTTAVSTHLNDVHIRPAIVGEHAWESEITSQMKLRNRLVLRLEPHSPSDDYSADRIWESVALEMRR
ncbi:MAG: hypothetical protein ACKVT0_24030 [Planctomycetaceae bacterium]